MEMVLAEIERILITGSRGWIGSRVCKVLKERGLIWATIPHAIPPLEMVAASRAQKVGGLAGASPFVDGHPVLGPGLIQPWPVPGGVGRVVTR